MKQKKKNIYLFLNLCSGIINLFSAFHFVNFVCVVFTIEIITINPL